jgi:hypothetical protein
MYLSYHLRDRISSLNDSDQEEDDSDDKKDVNEAANGSSRHKSQKPKNEQNDCDYFEHVVEK